MTTAGGPPPEPEALLTASSLADAAMERYMSGRTLPLYRMMGYHLGWMDENGEQRGASRPLRLRAGLCLLAAGAGGEGAEAGATALGHAVAVELVHSYSQIHGDVQEGNTDRDGRPAVWWVWGPAQAINAGDGMHALARLAVFGLREQGASPEAVSNALRALDEATLRLCEGSYYDAVYQERLTVPVDEYLSMAERAAGALVGCAVRLGALAAGETDQARLDALDSFGSRLGTALRITADYASFWEQSERESAVQGRMLSKKKSLPVAHALQEGDVHQKRQLGEMYAQRVLDPGDVEKIRGILEAAGSREFTKAAIERLRSEAFAALDTASPRMEVAAALRAAADYATYSPA